MPARHSHPAVPATPPPAVPAPEAKLVATLATAAEEVPMVAQRLTPRFARSEARRHAQAYLWGLLSPVERKNGWQLAEVVGDRTPYAIQHLLGRADWDADAVRDDLRGYVVAHVGDPHAILVLDETGVVKKGTASAGVAKQYVGSVGKLENAQVGVFLAYASPRGVAFLDRALYVPETWTDDRARCRAAGIPDRVGFATKPELGRQLLERARAAGVPAAWVTADSIYGDDRRLRMWLEANEQAYVLAVSGKEYVNVAATWTQRRVPRAAGAPAPGGLRALAVGAPPPERSDGSAGLRRLCTAGYAAGGAGAGSGAALDQRSRLRGSQGRSRPRPLRGAQLDGLVSPHDAGALRPSRPHRRARPPGRAARSHRAARGGAS